MEGCRRCNKCNFWSKFLDYRGLCNVCTRPERELGEAKDAMTTVMEKLKELELEIKSLVRDKHLLFQRNTILQQRVADLEMQLQQNSVHNTANEDW